MGALFGTLLAVGVVAILAAVPFTNNSAMMIGVRVFLAVLVFGLSSDVLMSVRAHAQAGREINSIRDRLRVAASNGHEEADIIYLMSEYNAAVEAAPVVVPLAYKLKRNTLNERWSQYLADRAAQGDATEENTVTGHTPT